MTLVNVAKDVQNEGIKLHTFFLRTELFSSAIVNFKGGGGGLALEWGRTTRDIDRIKIYPPK